MKKFLSTCVCLLLQAILLSVLSTSAFAQREINIWYFGQRAGLDFNIPPATVTSPAEVTTSAMSAFEGSAVACSRTTGQLLFYTDGREVFARNNTLMPNASGGNVLGGGTSSTQPALSVPHLSNPNRFVLFTTSSEGSGPAEFNIVDMTLNGGLGDIDNAARRRPLPTLGGTAPPAAVCEKIAGTRDAAGTGYWVVLHEFTASAAGSNAFYAYHVTGTTIDAVRVSNVGTPIRDAGGVERARGEMKFSPDGVWLATVNEEQISELFGFNNTTGAVTFVVTLDVGQQHYGLSFSPNSQLLYIDDGWQSTPRGIHQFNLANPAPAAITASRVQVGTSSVGFLGGMQIAPDGRIWIAKNGANHLGAINCPNVPGTGCGYTDVAFTFTGSRTSSWGLPSLILESVATPEFAGPDTSVCIGNSVGIGQTARAGHTYRWVGASSSQLSSQNIPNPVATPTATTDYALEITTPFGCIDRDTITVTVNPLPTVDPGVPVTICEGDSAQLGATSDPGVTFLWSPAASLSDPTVANPMAKPSATTTYTVVATSAAGCRDSSTVTITVAPFPVAVPSPDTSLCIGNSVQLNASGGAFFRWEPVTDLDNPNIANPVASPTTTTTYMVIVTNNAGCSDSANVLVTVNPLPIVAVSAASDTICAGEATQLTASGGINYRWSPGTGLSDSTIPNPMANPTASTIYTVVVENENGCTDSNSVTITVVTPTIRITLPDTVGDPHTLGYRIPIRIDIPAQPGFENFRCVPDSLTLELEFNASLFFPRSSSRGTITRNEVVNGRRIVAILFDPSTPIDTSAILTELIGDVMLGDSVSTPLLVRSMRFSGVVNSDSVNGLFTLIPICRQGGDRLLDFGEGFGVTKIVPNPSGGRVLIEVRTVELGATELAVYSAGGAEVFTTEWTAEQSALTGGELRQIALPSDLPGGVYQVVLLTPARRDVKTLIITK